MKKIDDMVHYSYPETETFGHLLISLPGICQWNDIGDVSSTEVIQRLIDIAVDFTREWDKVSYEEHDVLGEDYIEEIDKLADWIKRHAYDVFNNSLEYSDYKAKKRMYAIQTDFGREPGEKDRYYLQEGRYDSIADAVKAMLTLATSVVMGDGKNNTMDYHASDSSNQGLPICELTVGKHAFRYNVVTTTEYLDELRRQDGDAQ